MLPAEFLIEAADRCVRIASSGRRLTNELETINSSQANVQCSQVIAAGRELVSELEAVGQELLAKAVELDTQRQKSKPDSFGP